MEFFAYLTEDIQNLFFQVSYISRTEYRHLRQYHGHQDLPNIKPNEYWLPEGGATPLALKGVAELVTEIDIPYDILCAPCGTWHYRCVLLKNLPTLRESS